MTRLHLLLAALLVAVVAGGCAGAAPTPTPDPFTTLSERSAQAFREGENALAEGRYRDALNSFDRARVLSPSPDARIDQMIERTRAAMAVATSTPAVPPTLPPTTPTPKPSASLDRPSRSQAAAPRASAPQPSTLQPPAAAQVGAPPSAASPPLATGRSTIVPAVPPSMANVPGFSVGDPPTQVDLDPETGRIYVLDAAGGVWMIDRSGAQTSGFATPLAASGRKAVGLAVDRASGYLYLATSQCSADAPGCIVILDGRNDGVEVGRLPLTAQPGELRIDPELGLLYVVLPARQEVSAVDTRRGRLVPERTLDDVAQVSSLALDSVRHTLYVTQSNGDLMSVDIGTGQIAARVTLGGPGLSSVATANGLAYAVNTVSHELAVVDMAAQTVALHRLEVVPSAVASSDDTRGVYVVSQSGDVLLNVDPADGRVISRVTLAAPTDGPARAAAAGAVDAAVRARVVVAAGDPTAYVALPRINTVASVPLTTLAAPGPAART